MLARVLYKDALSALKMKRDEPKESTECTGQSSVEDNTSGQRTPPSIRTVSPFMNQLLTKHSTSAPMSVLDPAVVSGAPSSEEG